MSHNISNINGRNEMAYTGDKPWHGLGQELRLGASIEEWITAAGMDWKVKRSKVRYFCDKNGAQQLEWPVRKEKYAWPGGYPLALLLSDGALLCPACVAAEFSQISYAHRHRVRDGWRPEALVILEEGPEYCDHCNEQIGGST